MKCVAEIIANEDHETVYRVSTRSLLPNELNEPRIALLNRILEESDCKPIGDSWKSIPSNVALEYAKMGFSFDLAYTSYRITDDFSALRLVNLFFSQFKEDKEFYVNASDNPWTSKSYFSAPTTDSTFDLSLIIIDSKSIGLLCFVAED